MGKRLIYIYIYTLNKGLAEYSIYIKVQMKLVKNYANNADEFCFYSIMLDIN